MSPANIYLFKVNNRNTRKRCGICSELTIKTRERCHGRRSGAFIGNFEHIPNLFLVFLLLNLNKYASWQFFKYCRISCKLGLRGLRNFPLTIWFVLRDLIPFVQFKKREKHPSRSVTFSKVEGWSFQLN